MERPERVLTTHAGSLVRPAPLLELYRAKRKAKSSGTAFADQAAYEQCLSDSVEEVVHRQVETGLDIVSDGEFGKDLNWGAYISERISGLEIRPWQGSPRTLFDADRRDFKEFYRQADRSAQEAMEDLLEPGERVCTGPLAYAGQRELARDIANLRRAAERSGPVDAFLPVVAPASGTFGIRNAFYESDEAFLMAFAAVLNEEYRAIVDAGLIVQVDDAFLPYMYSVMLASGTEGRYREWAEMCIRVTKEALRGIPAERSRYHVCWGSWNGPHVHDVPLAEIVDLLLELPVGGYAIEHANPRHEHEWHVWERVELPARCTLIPGVISHATNVVEHPELVAERIVRLAHVVGRDRVIAGTDCGFAQAPSMQRLHPSIMWAKLTALADGAERATELLWP